MKYALVNWTCIEDLSPVHNEDGSVMEFESTQDAIDYGEGMNGEYQVIEIG